MAAKLVKKALGARGSETDDDIGNRVLKRRSSVDQIKQPVKIFFCVSHDDV